MNHPHYESPIKRQRRDLREELPTFLCALAIQKDALRGRRILEVITR